MDATVSASSPTSSSSTSSSTARWKYDVFLSFRGEDTCNSFTGLIYAALIKKDIITFKYDEKLEKGKLISEIFKGIEQSRFAIVIFSKDYASSTWCLDELAEIVQCEEEKGMTILPVFYDVQPFDVFSENGTFAHALIEHEKKNMKVQQWRDALSHVGNIVGWTVMNRRQSEVIQHIVERISEKAIVKQWSRAYEEISSDLNELKLTMPTIQAMLLEIEEKQVENRYHICSDLKSLLAHAAYELDKFEALRRRMVETHGSSDFASYSSFNLHDFSYRIKAIRERLEESAERIVQREMTHSFVHDLDVIGRDEDKEKIINLLMHPSEDDTIPVISIVGIRGMGKTVLAQWVYNDKRIAKLFQIRIWVCVSEEFTVLKLAKEILKSAHCKISENMSIDEVQATLRSCLKKKRFFIVLDDVRNVDRYKWICLKKLLIEGANGSKIVVTTRSHEVARVMAPGPIHDLRGLPEDDCLFLFLKWAFVEGEEKKYPKLVEIGKQIVKKCCSIPLAVRILGSLLFSKTKHDWISVRDDEIWGVEQKEDDEPVEHEIWEVEQKEDDEPVKQTTVEQAAALLLRRTEILSLVEGRLKTLKKAKEFPTPKIQKVRDLMNFEEYYTPRLLSLGPIHHGKEEYQLGEKYKLAWAFDFIEGCKTTMDNLYKKIEEKIEELRDCYEEEVTENYDDKDLAWLLFVDGCAILQFIYCAINKGNSKLGIINNSVDFVHQDLFFLENQLPYRLLKLLMSDNEKELRDSIKTYIQMHVMVPEGNPKEQRILRDEEPIHLLDLLRTALLGNPHEDSVIIPNRERDQHQISDRNVQELKAAGIHLRRSSYSCLRDISFSQSLNLLGHLYIPSITLNNLTRPMFLNLVAYENCDNFKNDIGVTSYIAFLRSLIKEAKDVRELRKAGIFYNLVGSDEEVAKLFNEMPMPFIPTNIGVEEKIEEYYGTMLSLMFRIYHDNFNSTSTSTSTSRGIFKLLVLVLGLSGIKYTTRMYPFIHAHFLALNFLALILILTKGFLVCQEKLLGSSHWHQRSRIRVQGQQSELVGSSEIQSNQIPGAFSKSKIH